MDTRYTPSEIADKIVHGDGHYVANQSGKLMKLINHIQCWGIDRNITLDGGATALSQMKKLQEELDELHVALKVGDERGVKDGTGDMLTVLIQVMRLEGLTIEECLEQAWNDIKDRRGRMVDGVFVKEA